MLAIDMPPVLCVQVYVYVYSEKAGEPEKYKIVNTSNYCH